MTQVVSYIEIDVPHCSLTYSAAPCTASIGVTGAIKCFNSLGTCQDRANFTDAPVTLRFGEDVPSEFTATESVFIIGSNILDESSSTILDENSQIITDGTEYSFQPEVFPFIKAIDFSPAIVSLGEDLGQRASLKVTFKDARHSDAGVQWDKYPGDRSYSDPFNRGTFWGKFRARNPFLRGRAIRLLRGANLQPLAEMETHHFVIESIDGPTAEGEFSIIAKDMLKFADNDRAQAPLLSNGFLNANITNVATSATLAPAGIGNAEYPASGYVAIGGSEICTFTRAADVLTLTRAQFNTEAAAHSAQDRVQVMLRYAGQSPADIIYDLLVTYAAVDPAAIPLSDWHVECNAYLGVVYTLNIPEPTGVADLIAELIEQMGAAIWWDDEREHINLQILRNISTSAKRWNEDVVLESTLELQEQPNKRISQVIVYFAQINPLVKRDEENNYRSTQVELDAQSEIDEGSAAIKKLFARGIPAGGRTVATRVAEKFLSRYVRPPRRFNFELLRLSVDAPELAEGVRLGGGTPRYASWPFQDETGARVDVPIQITRHNPLDDRHVIEAEEMLFTDFSGGTGGEFDPTNKTIILDIGENNINMRTRHDEIFGAPNSGDTVTCYITSGVIIGSNTTATPAFDVGTWPGGVTLLVNNSGRVQGCGGDGGSVTVSASTVANTGNAGGLAFYTRHAINLTNNSQIWGGGGGGGSTWVQPFFAAGGGGGAGTNPGAGGAAIGASSSNKPGANGTSEAGGLGGANTSAATIHGGNGGGPGQAGLASANTSGPAIRAGGAAGVAIDGTSFITYAASGDIQGSQIN